MARGTRKLNLVSSKIRFKQMSGKPEERRKIRMHRKLKSAENTDIVIPTFIDLEQLKRCGSGSCRGPTSYDVGPHQLRGLVSGE